MRRAIFVPLAFVALATPLSAQFKPGETVAQHRTARDAFLRGDLSPLALVHRTVWGDRRSLRIGTQPADLVVPTRFAGKPYGVLFTEDNGKFFFSVLGSQESQPVSRGPFRFERYILNFRPTGLPQGPVLDIYDSEAVSAKQFRGLDVFPENPAYRVRAELVALAQPQKIILIDSHGFNRPYWIYGHLTLQLDGRDVRLEVYTATLDTREIARDGFMLIFSDATSGKETYKSGRYLYIEGKKSGAVEVDFNKAYSPPCAFSPVFTCPFPRKENRLAIAIAAGEKTYRGPAAEPIP